MLLEAVIHFFLVSIKIDVGFLEITEAGLIHDNRSKGLRQARQEFTELNSFWIDDGELANQLVLKSLVVCQHNNALVFLAC
ncbi:hypothetical protein D3C86_1963030 [compost metagenome]